MEKFCYFYNRRVVGKTLGVRSYASGAVFYGKCFAKNLGVFHDPQFFLSVRNGSGEGTFGPLSKEDEILYVSA